MAKGDFLQQADAEFVPSVDSGSLTFSINRPHVERAFDNIASYNMGDTKIRLKVEHTCKAAVLCDVIACSLELLQLDFDLAWLCSIPYDIGRSEQMCRWGAFYESQLVNNAELGADPLFREGLIECFTLDSDLVVQAAIRNHNRLHVDPILDARIQMFCDIVRDADKIDSST